MTTTCKQETDTAVKEKTQTESSFSPVIVCRNCNNKITDPESQIEMDDAFRHTFANPHGHVFEIGCFGKAPGCIAASPPSAEFTWFKGYVWEIGICNQCGVHLGWVFSSDTHRFFGLILDMLIFP